MCVCVGSAQFLGEASRLSGSFSPTYGRSVRLLRTVCVFDDGCSRGASSVTLSSAPRALFDARPVRQDESTSTMSHKVFSIVWRSFQRAAGLCVELFPSVLLLNSMMMVLMQTQRRVSCRTFSREVKTNN